MTLTTFYTYVYHQHGISPSIIYKKSINFWNMTTPRNFAKNTRLGCAKHKTITLHRHTKQLNTTESSLFDIFPKFILTDIEIWVSGLEHRDKFMAVVSRINSMYNPIIYAITHELWTPYQNFRVYSWYNDRFYEWAHMRIPDPYNDLCSRYQYYGILSTGITKLTPEIIQSHKLAVTFQKIAWDENSSVPYSK